MKWFSKAVGFLDDLEYGVDSGVDDKGLRRSCLYQDQLRCFLFANSKATLCQAFDISKGDIGFERQKGGEVWRSCALNIFGAFM